MQIQLYRVYFPTKIALKRLLAKWTTATDAIATGRGKDIANTGIKTVPNPNPENSVMIEIRNEVMQIIKYSIFINPVLLVLVRQLRSLEATIKITIYL